MCCEPCVFRRPKGCAKCSLGGGRAGQGEEGNVLGVFGDALLVDIQYFPSPMIEMKQTPCVVTAPEFPVSPIALPSPQGGSSALAGKVCDRASLLGLCWVLAWGRLAQLWKVYQVTGFIWEPDLLEPGAM